MFRILIISFLFLLSAKSFSADLEIKNGRLMYPLSEKYNDNGFKAYKVLGEGGGIYTEYNHKFDKSLNVLESSTGARSLEKIPVKFTASVSRAGVLAGVGALVRQGAKLGTKAVPYVGTALLAYDIYKELNPELEKAGYKYSEDIGDYVKYYDNALCLSRFRSEPGYFSCVGVDSSELLALSKGSKETQDLLVRRVRAEFERLSDVIENELYPFPPGYIDHCNYYSDISVSCHYQKGLSLNFALKKKIKTSEPDPKSFDDLIAKKVDESPDKFIRATNFPGYKEDVEVAPGTKLNIGPVTDKSGNPVQLLVSFGRDSQGKTTADVQVTPRPDLKPGSAEAPNVRPLPDTSPATNPSNNPNPSDNPENRPNPEPANGREGKDGKDGGILCKMFPRILACDEQPEAEEPNLDLPQNTIDLNFKTDNSFQDNGQCPEPVSFQAFGQTFNISLDPICKLALMMRPIIIAMAWLMAAFFVTKTIREEV